METPRYLPASRVRESGQRHGGQGAGLSLRTLDGQDVGVVQGFVLEPRSARIRSLVIETGAGQRELPIAPLQYDPKARVLRIMSPTSEADIEGVDFAPGSLPVVSDDDLWVPIFHTAA
jgi:hypothetical protein